MERILIGNIEGKEGDKGDTGLGFPPGGFKGQFMAKKSDEDFDIEWQPETKSIVLEACGDLTVGQIKGYVPSPMALQITGIKAIAITAPTGADLILDINKNGTTIYTTQANRPIIPAGDTSVVADLPDDIDLLEDDMITIDVDQIGSTVAGSNLAVVIKCNVVSGEFEPL